MAPNTATGREVGAPPGLAPHRYQTGLVLLAILIFILITTMAAGGLVQLYQTQMQREKEEQLLFVGEQYKRAISSYYNTYPSRAVRSLPIALDVLLNDDRFPTPIQHLRRIYPDPVTGKADWVLIMERGGIVGVHSRSAQQPIKISGFPNGYTNFENKSQYAEWEFSIRIVDSGRAGDHLRPDRKQ